jgi:RimJ/RimL family protein N-acetyltransferase
LSKKARLVRAFLFLEMNMSVAVRLITPEDLAPLRALRMEALVHDGDAFMLSPEEESAQTDDAVRPRLQASDDAFMVGAFDDDHMVGMVGAARLGRAKVQHTFNVWGTYVRPAQRGLGVSKHMMQALIAHARGLPGVQCLKLGVIEGNESAIKAYEAVGFSSYAYEPLFMRVQSGAIAGQHMMMLAL